jgi:beta-galactosidase/beta-glucuronidase
MVMRWSAGTWLEDQDMWRMSGIFRSVWLLNKPTLHLSDVQLTPQLDALYRDAELLVNVSVAAPVALLEELTVKLNCGMTIVWSPATSSRRVRRLSMSAETMPNARRFVCR